MAVAVYCFTVVIPLSSIEHGYPDGLLAWFENIRKYVGSRIWFDDKLAAITYYYPNQSYDGVCEWQKLGFLSRLGSARQDSTLLCAQVDQQLGILDKDVDWLEFDSDIPSVWLKGSEHGRIAAPENVLAKLEGWRESDGKAGDEWLKKWGLG